MYGWPAAGRTMPPGAAPDVVRPDPQGWVSAASPAFCSQPPGGGERGTDDGTRAVRRPALLEEAMRITELLSANDIVLDLKVGSKQDLLRSLSAEAASRLGRPEQEVLDALLARERLGSTGLGRGVALPHTRLDGIEAPVTLFARLRRPIDFEAKDDEPVDLVFLVLWPEASPEGFLPALAEICRVLRAPQVLRRLRQAKSAEEVMTVLHEAEATAAAPPDGSGAETG